MDHWKARHSAVCKTYNQQPTVGIPFIVSLPKSQFTYNNLCKSAEKLARYVQYLNTFNSMQLSMYVHVRKYVRMQVLKIVYCIRTHYHHTYVHYTYMHGGGSPGGNMPPHCIPFKNNCIQD